MDKGWQILACILDARLQNLTLCKKSQSFRYEAEGNAELLKDFAALIYLYGGARVLELLLLNGLCAGLPGVDTVRRWLQTRGPAPLRESGLSYSRFNSITPFFQSLGSTVPIYHLANDGTALIPRLKFRSTDNALLGFAVSDADLPHTPLHVPDTFEELEALLDKYPLATAAEIYTLQPMDPRYPAIVIACFAQSGPADAVVTRQRLDSIVSALGERGIHVVTFSADGAAANLSMMTALYEV